MNELNLARKWRPKNFEEIIGQELSVSMLKNSLFLKKLFPVYLFSGQRGCGKTSSARIFAAAINCEKLLNFQKKPTQNIPCLECASCISMQKLNHPDFIEIDAASHTGVDNIRQVIESCSYMPLSGRKKIYLIDEAHMLSKSAFNAFLKILEEPPESAMFILATTELHKIPDTVRSRCFQANFNRVGKNEIKKHLKSVCEKENINIVDDALNLMLSETDGSVRDTLNLLEQVRFAETKITKDVVAKSLGKFGESDLLKLMEMVGTQNPKGLLEFLSEINFESKNPQIVWNTIVETIRQMLLIKYGVSSESQFKEVSEKFSINKLHALLQLMWSQEKLFIQTHKKHILVESVLLQMCNQTNIDDIAQLLSLYKNSAPKQIESVTDCEGGDIQKKKSYEKSISGEWEKLKEEVDSIIEDPVLSSIFKNSLSVEQSEDGKIITIGLTADNEFLREKLEESEELWEPLIQKYFPQFEKLEIKRIAEQEPKPVATQQKQSNPVKFTPPPKNINTYQNSYGNRNFSRQSNQRIINEFLIKNPEEWPKATLIGKYFSGKLEKISES